MSRLLLEATDDRTRHLQVAFFVDAAPLERAVWGLALSVDVNMSRDGSYRRTAPG
jgi:hypothetical protein